MCLNKPFWLVLRKKGHLPYFAMYVNAPNDEIKIVNKK
jgi:hypothetical protein